MKKEEAKIRTLIVVEKFKLKIHVQALRSEKYDIELNDVNVDMIRYFTATYKNDICSNLIDLREKDSKKEEEKSVKIFMKRRNGT